MSERNNASYNIRSKYLS